LAGTVALAALLAVGTAGPAHAAVIFEGDIPIAQVIVNPCIGEPLFVTGVFHIVIRAEEDTSGGVHYGYHLNTAQQFQGETASGVKYVETSSGAVTVGNFNGTKGAATEETITDTSTLTRQGETAPLPDDLYQHVTIHVTVNANGAVTADVQDIRIECK